MEILVPIFVCVVLPVAVVLISSLTKINGENKRAKIVIKAIEANKDIDTDKLVEALRKPKKTAREMVIGRLLRGCVCTLLGIALLVLAACMHNVAGCDPDLISLCAIGGGVCIPIGLSFLIVYFITRKQVE